MISSVIVAGMIGIGGVRGLAQSVPTPADVSIGGQVVMRLRSNAGGLSPEERAESIEDRLTRLVAVPDLKPADVVVYSPIGKSPVIYVLGRKLITVDIATAKAAGGGKPIDVAVTWAKRLQQVLPRVDIRLPNEHEPVIPANPPLTITAKFDQVGGQVGNVVLRDKIVMWLRGPQPDGMTAAERADEIGPLIAGAVHAEPDLTAADIKAITIAPVQSKPVARLASNASRDKDPVRAPKIAPASPPPSAMLMVGTRRIITIDDADSKAAGTASPLALAQSWAKNIRNVVFPAPKTPPAAAVPEEVSSPPAPSATTVPTPQQPESPTNQTPPTPAQPSPPEQTPSTTPPPSAPSSPTSTQPENPSSSPTPSAPQ